MEKLKLPIIICVIAALSWMFVAGTASLKIVDENSAPEFWGGSACEDCDWNNPWTGCETKSACSQYNNKATSCDTYWRVVNTQRGWKKTDGFDSATLYNMGKCADIYDCHYDTQSGDCSQNADIDDQNWYLSCQETT